MSLTLEYVTAKAALAAKMARADNLKGAIEELAIGVAYLADFMRKGVGPRSSGEQPEEDE